MAHRGDIPEAPPQAEPQLVTNQQGTIDVAPRPVVQELRSEEQEEIQLDPNQQAVVDVAPRPVVKKIQLDLNQWGMIDVDPWALVQEFQYILYQPRITVDPRPVVQELQLHLNQPRLIDTTPRSVVQGNRQEGKLSNKIQNPATSFLDIPSDSLARILSTLQVDNYFQLNCVSISWQRFLSDPHFTERMKFSPLILVETRGNLENWKRFFGICMDSAHNSPKSSCKLRLPLRRDTNIVGSCDGFLCMQAYDRSFHIYNPITAEWLTLPNHLFEISYPMMLGFGRSLVKKVFKIILFSADDVMILTIGVDKGWRKKENLVYPLVSREWGEEQQGVFLNGSLYWMGKHILVFDLDDEKFREILLPTRIMNLEKKNKGYEAMATVGVIQNELSLVANVGRDLYLYVMKHHKDSSSWKLRMVVKDERVTIETKVLICGRLGQLVLLHDGELGIIDPKTEKRIVSVVIDGVTRVTRAFVFVPNFALLEDLGIFPRCPMVQGVGQKTVHKSILPKGPSRRQQSQGTVLKFDDHAFLYMLALSFMQLEC